MANSIFKDPEETVFYYLDTEDWQQIDEGITDINVQVVEFNNESVPTAQFDDAESIELTLVDENGNKLSEEKVDTLGKDRIDILLEDLYLRADVTESLLTPTGHSTPSKWVQPTDMGYRLSVTGGEAGHSYSIIANIYTESMRKKDIYVPIFVRKYYDRG